MSTGARGFRQSQSVLHTWSGLLLGWVLFVIFVAGSIAFWREELNRWMRPELARIEQPHTVLAQTDRFLRQAGAGAQSWFIEMPSTRSPGARVFWQRPGDGWGDNKALIGADGKAATARETEGGEFFYRFHFDLRYMPILWARWIVGVAAMAMLVAILSGIVTHKKIFKDFFTLRRAKGQRSWLDGHNATAVLALPFHLMMTYTGLITLMTMLMPWAIVANYEDNGKFFQTQFPQAEAVERANRPAPLADLVTVVRDAERRLGGRAGYIDVSGPGDASARISVSRSGTSMLSARTPRLTYDGVTGKLLWQSPAPGGASKTDGAMIGLHAGRYAGYAMRWLYFLCGVGGALMVASGLVLWTVKRREKLPDPARPHLGFVVVERLNVAVVGGFPLAVAGLFWANRLLPLGLAGRAEWEVHSLFITWAAALVVSVALRPARAWAALLGLTGALLAALPFYNMLATSSGLFTTLAQGDFALAGADLTMIAFGAAFLATARYVARYRPPAPRQRARRVAAREEAPA